MRLQGGLRGHEAADVAGCQNIVADASNIIFDGVNCYSTQEIDSILRRAADLVCRMTETFGRSQILRRLSAYCGLRRVKTGNMTADNLICFPAIDAFRADVPRYDVSIAVERDQGEVTDGIEDASGIGDLLSVSRRSHPHSLA
nr:hypothetical protein [Microvirga sp. 3-52]